MGIDIERLKLFSPMDGNFFPVLLLFSLGMFFFVRSWDHWLVLGIILMTIAMNPHAWWDRFIPQLFALPVLILMILRQQSRECPLFWTRRWNFAIGSFLAFALLNSSCEFLTKMRYNIELAALESKEMTIWQASSRLLPAMPDMEGYPEKPVQLYPETLRNFYITQYVSHSGAERLPKLCLNQVPDWENEDIFYVPQGCVYILPKKNAGTIQTEDEIFIDFSDVEISELPCHFVHVGKVRWKQLRNAWNK